jgi:hypothetical protein
VVVSATLHKRVVAMRLEPSDARSLLTLTAPMGRLEAPVACARRVTARCVQATGGRAVFRDKKSHCYQLPQVARLYDAPDEPKF